MVRKEEYIQLRYRFCWCHRCGFEWIISDFVIRCPDCDSGNIGVIPLVFYDVPVWVSKKSDRDVDIDISLSYAEYDF